MLRLWHVFGVKEKKENHNIDQFLKAFRLGFIVVVILSTFIILAIKVEALNELDGERLFIENCSGCHVKGGNIIRRNKTLKIKDLKRNGIETPELIAEIAREGIGSMSGYKEVLGEKGDQIVANWIWQQSQSAWTQG